MRDRVEAYAAQSARQTEPRTLPLPWPVLPTPFAQPVQQAYQQSHVSFLEGSSVSMPRPGRLSSMKGCPTRPAYGSAFTSVSLGRSTSGASLGWTPQQEPTQGSFTSQGLSQSLLDGSSPQHTTPTHSLPSSEASTPMKQLPSGTPMSCTTLTAMAGRQHLRGDLDVKISQNRSTEICKAPLDDSAMASRETSVDGTPAAPWMSQLRPGKLADKLLAKALGGSLPLEVNSHAPARTSQLSGDVGHVSRSKDPLASAPPNLPPTRVNPELIGRRSNRKLSVLKYLKGPWSKS